MILNLEGTSKNQFEIGNLNDTYDLILKKSGSMTESLTFTFPANKGTSGQVLQTDGNGTTSWVTSGASNDYRENHIINGAHNIWQDGTSFAAVANGTYGPEMFRYSKVGAMVDTMSRSTNIPSGSISKYSLKTICTTADTSIASTDLCMIEYRMEGYDYQKVRGKNIIVNFKIYATVTGTYCLALKNSGSNRSYVQEYTVNASNTWQTINVLFNLSGAEDSGTWDIENGIGLKICFTKVAGSNYQTTAGSWQNGNYVATSNQVNACNAVDNEFIIHEFQLLEGTSNPSFYRQKGKSFQDELAMCQRYYEKSYSLNTAPGTATYEGAISTYAIGTSSNLYGGTRSFNTSKRIVPTMISYSPATGTAYRVSDGGDNASGTTSYRSQWATGHPVKDSGSWAAGTIYVWQWTANARM